MMRMALGCVILGWPFLLGQKPHGAGWHAWVWAVAVPWWVVLLIAGLVALGLRAQRDVREQAVKARENARRNWDT
jgi:hypothetical protein